MLNEITSSIKSIVKLSLPITLTNIINILATFLATFMLSKLGKDVLAASALCNTTFIMFSVIASTCLYSVSILISKAKATEDYVTIRSVFQNSIWVTFVLIIPVAILLWCAPYFLLLFRQDPHLVNLTIVYFHYATIGMIPMLFNTLTSQFYIGIGYTTTSMVISFIRLPITVLLSYIFIYGKFSFIEMGLGGVTYALLISNTICLIGTLLYMALSKKIWHYIYAWGDKIYNKSNFNLILKVGIPIGLQFFGEMGAISIATYFMGYFGVNALAASQIVSQYTLILVMIILGIAQAVSILVSQAYGNKQLHIVNNHIIAANSIIIMLFVCFIIIYVYNPIILIEPFININNHANYSLIHLTKVLLLISVGVMFFDGIKNIYTSGLRGFQNSKLPMFIGVGSLWLISLPISYIVGIYFSTGPIGMRIGFMSGFVIATLILWKFFHKEKNIIISTQNEAMN